jgi:hypothetical protein
MSEYLYLITLGLLFGVPLLIFAMKYASAAYQARARIQGDDAYRNLASKAVTAQSEGAASLSNIQSDLSEIKVRLAAVEKILKAVE